MKKRPFLIILIFLSLNFLQAQDFKQIQNRWKPNQYLHNESGKIEAGPLGAPGWHSAHWQFIPVPGTKYVQIKNRFGSKFYLHIEYGKVQVGPLGAPGWWSAQWEIVKVPGTNFVRIKNRWKPNQYLHIEYGKVQVGPLGKPGWWSAQWLIKKPSGTPGPTPVATSGFKMIFISDTQFPWVPVWDDPSPHPNIPNPEEISRKLNKDHVKSINKLIASESNVKGVIINGDLTATGKSSELDEFEQIYKNINAKMYMGLGNHDYANYVNDTRENNRANRMVKFMRDHVKRNGIGNFDFKESDSYEFPSLVKTIQGSLSYSWDIENVHFVQCQNFPIYERNWSDYVSGEAKRYTIKIQNSLDWLENDLAKARRAGKIIILNYHDSDEHWKDVDGINPESDKLSAADKQILATFKPYKEKQIKRFQTILQKYNVAAVFVGHYHKSLGKGTPSRFSYGKVPVFYCGSSSQSKYLLVNFDGNKMTVEKVNSKVGKAVKTKGGVYTLYNTARQVTIPRKQGKITFFNEGGYVARYFLTYYVDGVKKEFKTGNMALGNKKSYTIPGNATSITVKGQGDAVFSWTDIFSQTLSVTPESKCYKTYATIFDPAWNNNCE